MTAEDIIAIMAFLRNRITLNAEQERNPPVIVFQDPTEDEMIAAGINADAVRQVRNAPWWSEMVTDIVETPDFCEPDDPPHQVLAYAKDVVSDYVQKRVSPSSEK